MERGPKQRQTTKQETVTNLGDLACPEINIDSEGTAKTSLEQNARLSKTIPGPGEVLSKLPHTILENGTVVVSIPISSESKSVVTPYWK